MTTRLKRPNYSPFNNIPISARKTFWRHAEACAEDDRDLSLRYSAACRSYLNGDSRERSDILRGIREDLKQRQATSDVEREALGPAQDEPAAPIDPARLVGAVLLSLALLGALLALI